jgi:hypothetical protein
MVLEETRGDWEKAMDLLLGMAGDFHQGQSYNYFIYNIFTLGNVAPPVVR